MPPEIARLFSEFGPTAYGVWTLIALNVAWWIKGDPERRRVKSESDISLRKDLLGRIDALEKQREVDSRAREQDRRECAEEQSLLRKQIQEQDTVIAGLQRQLIAFQITVAQAMPPSTRSPEIEKMLERVLPYIHQAGGPPV